MKKLHFVPLFSGFLFIFICGIAVAIDSHHLLGNQSESIWYMTLLLVLIFSYYYGLVGGLSIAILAFSVHLSEGIFGHIERGYAPFQTQFPIIERVAIVNLAVSIGIGILADRLKLKQRELEKLNEKLQEAEAKYRSLVEEALIGVYLYQEEKLFYVNPKFSEFFGYSQEEIQTLMISELYYSEDHSKLMDNFRKILLVKSIPPYQIRGVKKDKTIIDIEVSGTLTQYQGKPAIIGTVMDITDRKRNEELLRKSDKLSVIGQLAAGVAHEIRNPLTSLKGFLQILSRENQESKYIQIMSSELERINIIVGEFLYLAKPQAVRFKQHSLKTLLQDVITLIEAQANMNNIQILLEFHANDLFIICEDAQLKQVFINLLKNAIEAMPNGGEISIQVDAKHNETILIRFIDQGCGIPNNRIPKLGEPFYTTKDKGTGLGLMVSFKIIEDHHGKIQYTSELNKGTIVDVILPKVQNAS